jgi:putative NIF3 family GTP cyclohydrolase 1 type 2
VIWRFHDYLHSIPPDNTVIGMVSQMGWNKFASAEEPYLCTIPPVSLQELVSQVKNDFHLQNIRLAGDPSMICKKVALLPGAPGGEWQINALGQPDVDVLIAGEINEWEVNEYVRDATQLGISKGLIVIGHASSEEEGIRRMLPWLQEHLPGITLHFAPTSQALHSL